MSYLSRTSPHESLPAAIPSPVPFPLTEPDLEVDPVAQACSNATAIETIWLVEGIQGPQGESEPELEPGADFDSMSFHMDPALFCGFIAGFLAEDSVLDANQAVARSREFIRNAQKQGFEPCELAIFLKPRFLAS
jgi:hypothetical protein